MISYRKNSSKIRRLLDIIDDFMNRFVIIYWISLGLSIAFPTIIVFYSLPENIRTPLSGVVGGAISLVLIPLTINHINKKNAQRINLYNDNKDLYYELSKIIISIISDKSNNSHSKLNTYIKNNYCKMCLTFNTSLIDDIINLSVECKVDDINIKYYCEKILKKIRKEAGINGVFHINSDAALLISSNT